MKAQQISFLAIPDMTKAAELKVMDIFTCNGLNTKDKANLQRAIRLLRDVRLRHDKRGGEQEAGVLLCMAGASPDKGQGPRAA